MNDRIEELLEEIKKEITGIKKEKIPMDIKACIKKIEEIEHILRNNCPVFKKLEKEK